MSSVAFAHDGKRLAWGTFGGLVRAVQLAPRRAIFQVRLVGNHRVAYSGDGKWLALPNVAAVGGSWLAPAADIRAGNWSAITERVRQAVGRLRSSA